MHILGHYGKENAAAIFELFLECMPEYPLDKPDAEGNTGEGAAWSPLAVPHHGSARDGAAVAKEGLHMMGRVRLDWAL